MKTRKILCVMMAAVMCLASFAALAEDSSGQLLIMQAPDKGVTVNYNDEAMQFDVEPLIEDGRTLVPFRAIFEIMGCNVGYSEDENGGMTVTANRGEDSLMLRIGEPKMYFNAEEITLDVPAKIVNGRTLVPIRAITEAFECDVLWDGESETVSIYPPEGYLDISAQKLTETVNAEDGTLLIEVTAYYPVIENPEGAEIIEEINSEYRRNAEEFVADAQEYKADAQMMYEQKDEGTFLPFAFSLTYEEEYNVDGVLSITNYKYSSTGGAHPSMILESGNYSIGGETELSLSQILDEKALGTTLREYIYELFSPKLEELGEEPDEDGVYTILEEAMSDVQYYLKKDALVIYFNQYQIAPYAAGRPSVEIPYDEEVFLVALSENQPEGVISPLPATVDINSLDDCTVAVSLNEGDAYVDDNGAMQMKVKVYAYDLYDMVDIAALEEGDTIVRLGENVKVTTLERKDTGLITINGGLENGGFELCTDESTVYYEVGFNDAKAYYEVGEATIPVSTEFIFVDASDLDNEPVEYYPGDFLTDDAGIEYHFVPNNTSIVIAEGYVVEMNRRYIP